MILTEYMRHDHGDCDESFARAESAANAGDLEKTRTLFGEFAVAITHHISMEENVLFPEFERRTGMYGGPTAVMRMEHEQVKSLIAQMNGHLAAGDLDEFLGLADTLNILIQQHNMKEENMLYPMSDRVLADDAGTVLERMKAVDS